MRQTHLHRTVKAEFNYCLYRQRQIVLCNECYEAHRQDDPNTTILRSIASHEPADCVSCGAVNEVAAMEELLMVPPTPKAYGGYGSPRKRTEWR